MIVTETAALVVNFVATGIANAVVAPVSATLVALEFINVTTDVAAAVVVAVAAVNAVLPMLL